MSSRHIRLWMVVAFTLFSAMLVGFLPPLPQNPAYHLRSPVAAVPAADIPLIASNQKLS